MSGTYDPGGPLDPAIVGKRRKQATDKVIDFGGYAHQEECLPVSNERAVEAMAHRLCCARPPCKGHIDEAEDILAELDRQGVRLVEQPKCSRCVGSGETPTDTYGMMGVDPCSRCGGSGYEPLVPLREAEDQTKYLRSLAGVCGNHPSCHSHPCIHSGLDALVRRFGGGER